MNLTKHCNYFDVQPIPPPGELLLNIMSCLFLVIGPIPHCRPQHRKYITYHNAVRRRPSRAQNLAKFGRVVFSARCNIYISRLCYDVSVRLSVRLSVTEVHWRIIANLGFKFQSHFTAHCGRRAARRAACGRIISRHASQC